MVLAIFFSSKEKALDDETAWARLHAQNCDPTAHYAEDDIAAVRRLRAKCAKVTSWTDRPGAHHRSRSGARSGKAATEKRQNAHKAKNIIRQRFSKDLLALAEAVVAMARRLASSVLGK